MTLLFASPEFVRHRTGNHPEKPARIERVLAMLEESELTARCARPQWKPATAEQVARCHKEAYVEQIRDYAASGGGRIEADTVVSPESFQVAMLAAGAACAAVDSVIAGDDPTALCLVRPPGHHALAAGAMGFCLFNNVAVAARQAIGKHKLNRVLIVDFDVHHGNGTQDAFYDDEQVALLSVHRWPFYPGTGSREETGAGRGLGYTVNLPLEFGTPRPTYHDRFASALEALAAKMKPELVLVSAGFDAHRDDQIGSLGLEVDDFSRLTGAVKAVAAEHCQGRLVSLLEGGYNLDVLPQCVEAHLRELLG